MCFHVSRFQMSCFLDLCLLNGIVYQPEGCETPCCFPLLKRCGSHVFIDSRFMLCYDCCFLVPCCFNLSNCLELSMLMRTLTFLGPGTLFLRNAKHVVSWKFSRQLPLDLFRLTKSKSQSITCLTYFFDLDFNPECFYLMCLIFCCRSELEAAPHLQQLLPVPRCIGTLDRFVETC